MKPLTTHGPLALVLGIALLGTAQADENHAVHQSDAVTSGVSETASAAMDIIAAHVHRDGALVTFHMTTNGTAGTDRPDAVGALAGAAAWTYVWPTTLDPSVVGFEPGAGILAMAAAIHPDFDDTPLFDENGNGSLTDDGAEWHSHWVVLAPDDHCGPGALGVKDIPEGTTPPLPATWPGLPILIDSPGFSPVFDGPEVSITAPITTDAAGAGYDGVTAALRVNANIHAPLLCVTDVFDIASGDLSLPGVIN